MISRASFGPFFMKGFLFIASLSIFLTGSLVARTPSTTPNGIFALDTGGVSQGGTFLRTLTGYEKQFLSTTGFTTQSYPPVLVVLHQVDDAGFSSSSLRVDSIEGGLPRIQVDLIGDPGDGGRTRKLLAKAMILREYYGSSAPLPGSQIPEFPEWLIHGLGVLCSPSSGKKPISSQFLRGETPPTVEDFLIQRPPQDENHSLADLYDAMAAALLKAALKSENASSTLIEWIGHYDPNVPRMNSSAWPVSWKMRPVEKRWLLQMAGSNVADEGATKLLTVPEAFRRYDALLQEVPTQDHSLAMLKQAKGSDFIIQELSGRLLALRLQSNPMAIPLFEQTILFLTDIKHNSLKKLQEREKILVSLRADILKQSADIEGYLDWYEASKVPVRSGLFDRLLSTPETPVRKGPVGRYLDVIEGRGWQ